MATLKEDRLKLLQEARNEGKLHNDKGSKTWEWA